MGNGNVAQRASCVVRRRTGILAVIACAIVALSEPTVAERIVLFVDDPSDGVIEPGTSFSVLAVLRDNTTPLAGYTLNVDIAGVPAMHVGTVTASVGLTNFFLPENLIEQDPDDMLHPMFSVISDPGDDGAFINAISNSLGVVDLAVEGVSDALTQIVFNVPLNALGEFVISLGKGSSLGDADLEPVPFSTDSLIIEVVPEPTTVALQLLALAAWSRRRRRRAGIRA